MKARTEWISDEERKRRSNRILGDNNPMKNYIGENHPYYKDNLSPEMRESMSQRRRQQNFDNNPMKNPDVVAKISGDNSASKRLEVREKISKTLTGRPRTVESIEKQRQTMLAKGENHSMKKPEVRAKFTGGNNVFAKAVVQLGLDSSIISEYACCKDAVLAVGGTGDLTCLIACLKGRTKQYKGYKWMYKSEYEQLNK